MTFLINYGMPIDHGEDHVRINKGVRNTNVVIDGLSSGEVQKMFKSIHFHETNQKFYDVPLYCTAIRKMTPKKDAQPKNDNENSLETAINGHENVPKVNTPDEKKDEAKNKNDKNDQPLKSVIPGLPEKDRLKKPKKKKKKTELDNAGPLTKQDFMISPEKKKEVDGFLFSDNDEESSDEESSDEDEFSDEFEDSQEIMSENDISTPVNSLAKRFAITSGDSPTTTTASKRTASSPADVKETKKSRDQEKTKTK